MTRQVVPLLAVTPLGNAARQGAIVPLPDSPKPVRNAEGAKRTKVVCSTAHCVRCGREIDDDNVVGVNGLLHCSEPCADATTAFHKRYGRWPNGRS